jgi:16S rRNA (guanine(966)-N(2))-methyltransferase RsmD
MRVLAGTLKGQRLTTPAGRTTRPTADQVRIACLDTLMPFLAAGPFLDLFAGAGGVGIEALSRGAPSATFVEQDGAALRALRDNVERLGLGARARVERGRTAPRRRRGGGDAAWHQGAAARRAGRAHALESAPIRGDDLDFLSTRRVD